jgi:acyl-homoserine-lactone acylase
VEESVEIAYRTADGGRATRTFRVYRTHRGPIVRAEGGRWASFAMMHRPVEALTQSFQRTKARDFADYYLLAMELRANSSNNTLYADADGNIAYLHPQFIPRRSDRFDYTRPVDGSDPASDWNGLHDLGEAPFVRNPGSGWAMNTNNWPYSAAGPDSPREADFPRYMDTFGENPRGRHAIMLLQGSSGWTIDRLQAAAYDSYQPSFAELVPLLVSAFDALRDGDPLRRRLAEPIAALRGWDFRWGVESVPNPLGIFWLEELMGDLTSELRGQRTRLTENMAAHTTAIQKLRALERAVARLEREFGTWRKPWGEINRFQRLTGDIVQPFSDRGPSIPVGFTSGLWGSLASFGARPYPGTTRWYGTSGNSFVAIVEFGPDGPRARAVSAGGESGDPRSPHFNDQAGRYADGNLREVHFTPEQVRRHAVRSYRP